MPLPRLPFLPVLLAAALPGACTGPRHHHVAAPAVVLPEPASSAMRARAQLGAGHFAAAADGFAAARALGDDAPATLLGHALALAGSWRHEEAAQLLLADGAALPASDRGLALALAGETGVAIRLLLLAVEEQPGSAVLRQNLAFAFAMAGRWGEARALAAIDVPPGHLPARMEKWARAASAGPTPERVALMLDIAPPAAPQPRHALAWRRPHWAGARW
ncbi:hypothetical protein [Croceibacterium mercuriale]|uniref:hypothetical protein n=1 Tax=Croceibacterium mercuriale TaxID=1572751 RepID=UPI000692049D|nr:hypothetical protein [Croceibacterium mercuriale]